MRLPTGAWLLVCLVMQVLWRSAVALPGTQVGPGKLLPDGPQVLAATQVGVGAVGPLLASQDNIINNAAKQWADAKKLVTDLYGLRAASKAGTYGKVAVAIGSAVRDDIAKTQAGLEAVNGFAKGYITDKLAKMEDLVKAIDTGSAQLQELLKYKYGPAAAIVVDSASKNIMGIQSAAKAIKDLASTVGSQTLQTYGTAGKSIIASLAGAKGLLSHIENKGNDVLKKAVTDYILSFGRKVGGLAGLLKKLNDSLGTSGAGKKFLVSAFGPAYLQYLQSGFKGLSDKLGGDSKLSSSLDGVLSLFGLGQGTGALKGPVDAVINQISLLTGPIKPPGGFGKFAKTGGDTGPFKLKDTGN